MKSMNGLHVYVRSIIICGCFSQDLNPKTLSHDSDCSAFLKFPHEKGSNILKLNKTQFFCIKLFANTVCKYKIDS
jgi:hypothetical protein